MDLIPSSAPHWHLLLNHFPSVGTVIALALLLASFYFRSEDLRRAGLVLFVVLGLIAIPTYISGAAANWTFQRAGDTDISAAMVAAHQDAATLALTALLVTAWMSWFALWQYRRFTRPFRWALPAVVVLGLVTLGFMVQTGSLGGDINHPEIRGPEFAAPIGEAGWTASIADVIFEVASLWPALEAAHFMGMAVLFGVVLLVSMRVFGLVKFVPFSAFHRLLPIGAFGFVVNVVTGMVFFIADSGRYTAMTYGFYPKMALILIGGVAVLYFTVFDRPWQLKQGDAAPISAKAVAAATVLLWSGVIVYGRLLPYLE